MLREGSVLSSWIGGGGGHYFLAVQIFHCNRHAPLAPWRNDKTDTLHIINIPQGRSRNKHEHKQLQSLRAPSFKVKPTQSKDGKRQTIKNAWGVWRARVQEIIHKTWGGIQVNHNRQATNNCIMRPLSLKPHPLVELVSSKRHGLTVYFWTKCQYVSCGTRGMENSTLTCSSTF